MVCIEDIDQIFSEIPRWLWQVENVSDFALK